jgi:hypothetical protein
MQEIIREIKKKKKLLKGLITYGGVEMEKNFKEHEKHVTKITRNAKRRMKRKNFIRQSRQEQ